MSESRAKGPKNYVSNKGRNDPYRGTKIAAVDLQTKQAALDSVYANMKPSDPPRQELRAMLRAEAKEAERRVRRLREKEALAQHRASLTS